MGGTNGNQVNQGEPTTEVDLSASETTD